MKFFSKSKKYLSFAEKYIPLGSQTFSKSYLVYPKDFCPLFIKKGKGALVWDLDNNKYVDLVSALLPVILGYCDKDINYAIKQQLKNGIIFSLSSVLEAQLAKILTDIIPGAEKVRFAKNGSDATSACIRLARAYTKREHVICCGYHGWQDWFIGTTTRSIGVPKTVKKLTHSVEYNNLDKVEKLLNKYKNNVAAFILEPANFTNPKNNYFKDLQYILKKNGTLLIFDEVCTGFRFSLGGAQEMFGIVPDLSAFGKSMGNGMPISAIVGKSKIMNLMSKIFFSTTFAGECLSLAAAIATIQKIKSCNVIKNIWDKGEKIKNYVSKEIIKNNLDKYLSIRGYAPWTSIKFHSTQILDEQLIKTFFIKEMIQNGVLINSTNNISYSLNKSNLKVIFKSYANTFKKLKYVIDNKDLKKILKNNKSSQIFSIRS